MASGSLAFRSDMTLQAFLEHIYGTPTILGWWPSLMEDAVGMGWMCPDISRYMREYVYHTTHIMYIYIHIYIYYIHIYIYTYIYIYMYIYIYIYIMSVYVYI